jgi:hypothetical protein
MGKLDAKKRNALPDSDFAGPGRSYPIPDKAHAANAKARAAQFASPAEKARIDAKADKVLKAAGGTKTVPGKRPKPLKGANPPGPIPPDTLKGMVSSLKNR